MKCICGNELKMWQGYGEVGLGCECGVSFLPKTHWAALSYSSKFSCAEFDMLIQENTGTCTTHACPQCFNILKQYKTNDLSLKHCSQCSGILMTMKEAIRFFDYFKIQNNSNKHISIIADLPLINLFF